MIKDEELFPDVSLFGCIDSTQCEGRISSIGQIVKSAVKTGLSEYYPKEIKHLVNERFDVFRTSLSSGAAVYIFSFRVKFNQDAQLVCLRICNPN